MTEQKIQAKLMRRLEKEGYFVIKLIVTNKKGIPDVLALKEGEPPRFIEVKTPKGKLSKLQEFYQRHLKEKYAFTTEVFRGEE